MNLIDNKLQIAKLRLAYMVSFFLGNLFLVFAFFSDNNGFVNNTVGLVIAIVLLCVFLFLLIIKPEYIFIQISKKNSIIVRTYSAFPMFRKYKSFEIPLNTIIGLERKKNNFYPKPYFRFVVKTKKSIGKYPWLSLSAVPKKDFNRMITYLNKSLKLKESNI